MPLRFRPPGNKGGASGPRKNGERVVHPDGQDSETMTGVIKAYDGNRDRILQQDEFELLREARGASYARLVSLFDLDDDGEISPEELETCDRAQGLFDKVFTLDALSGKYATANKRRGQYGGVVRHLSFMIVLFVMLVLQMRPAQVYEVTDIMSTLVPKADGKNAERLSSVSELYAWLGDTLIGPAWKDPRCGDGVCEAPEEFPGFGRFGCSPDCGVARNLTAVEVKMESHFIENDSTSPGDLPAFLLQTSWNLCSPTHDNICWWAADQKFSKGKQVVVDRLDVPDGVWDLRVKAPFGLVRYEVKRLGSATANTTLLSSTYCVGTASNASATNTTTSFGRRRRMLMEPRGNHVSAGVAAAEAAAAASVVSVSSPLPNRPGRRLMTASLLQSNTPWQLMDRLRVEEELDEMLQSNYLNFGGRECDANGSRIFLMIFAQGGKISEYEVKVVRELREIDVQTPVGEVQTPNPDADFFKISGNASHLGGILIGCSVIASQKTANHKDGSAGR